MLSLSTHVSTLDTWLAACQHGTDASYCICEPLVPGCIPSSRHWLSTTISCTFSAMQLYRRSTS